jgi:pimeloyl-ACP methyl ester carboxylesterase
MPTIAVADARIPYTVTGEPGRRPLVLVHGTGPGAAITWGHLTPAWAATHLVVAPDLSGSAAAEDDGGELTVDRLAAQVIAVIEDLGADRPADVIGFSLGSPVAAAVAATRPDLVHRLVLIAGWADSAADPYLQTLFRTWIDAAPLPTVFGRISALTGFSTGFLAAAEPGLIEDLAAGMPPTPGLLRQLDLDLRVDVTALLPRITAPTLVLGAARDQTIPVRHARALHAAIPGSSYAELDSGHVVLFEQAEQLLKLTGEFLAEG